MRTDVGVALLAAGGAGLAWVAWDAAGVDLAVRTGTTTQQVGLVSALVTTIVVAMVAAAVLRMLERRTTKGLLVWTWLGAGVLLVSLLGPLGATTPAGVVALASLHLLVAAVVLVGQRRLHHQEVA